MIVLFINSYNKILYAAIKTTDFSFFYFQSLKVFASRENGGYNMWNVINSSSISLLLICIQQSENKKARSFRQYLLCLSSLLWNRFVDWFDFWDIYRKVIELCSLLCPGNCLSTIHEEPVASPASTVSGERNGVKTVPLTSRKTFNPAVLRIRIRDPVPVWPRDPE